MKDFLERVFALVPTYLDQLLRLVAAPKRFVLASLTADQATALQAALLFFGVSFAIGWAIELPLVRDHDPLVALATDAMFVLVYVLMYGAATIAAWRAVGATAQARDIFTIHVFYAAIIKLLTSAAFVFILGVMRIVDPPVFGALVRAIDEGSVFDFVRSPTFLSSVAAAWCWPIAVATGFLIAVWLVTGWGAYRALSGVSRFRSAMALALFSVLCAVVTLIVAVLAAGMAA